MGKYNLSYKIFGERSILIEWPATINENILNDILAFKKELEYYYNSNQIYIKTAYTSVLISYQSEELQLDQKILELKTVYNQTSKPAKKEITLWQIPVCYDEFFGIDLIELSYKKQMPVKTIIDLHTSPLYVVYFIGFLPGFLYLGGLNQKLFQPRKNTPRSKVKKGAVAIGGEQTGIYPNESPAGWNIIGNTPISFFNATKTKPCFASAGDKIKFHPVSLKEYNVIKKDIANNNYQIESEVVK